jgi:DNA-binding CsgD family transcriptional regulator
MERALYKLGLDGREYLESKLLSPAEIKILEFLYQLDRNEELACKLFVTKKTIKFHYTRIYRKLQVGNRFELMILLKDFYYRASTYEKINVGASAVKRGAKSNFVKQENMKYTLPTGTNK